MVRPTAKYVPLPTSDPTTGQSTSTPLIVEHHHSKIRRASKKKVFAVLLACVLAFVLMYRFRNNVMRGGRKGVGCTGAFRPPPSRGLATEFKLPSGDKIPSVALGVWKAGKGEVGDAVKTALTCGYRHIDDAWIYGNEAEVGNAIASSSVSRKDIWLTSKLWNTFHSPADIEPALDESLKALQTDYLDLYLIHWPIAFKKGTQKYDSELSNDPYPTWAKLEELVDKGKIRNIGISNFNIPRIQNLTSNSLKHVPAVNQVELSIFNPQPTLVSWAKANNILLEAYSPLGSSSQVKDALKIPVVRESAERLGMTPAQVMISWQLQRGIIVLPKSVHPGRIEENLQVRHLPQDVFNKINEWAEAHESKRAVNPSKGWGLDFDVFDDVPEEM